MPDATVELAAPPVDVKAEQALLAALLIDPDNVPAVARILPDGARTFHQERHRRIYQAITDLDERGEPIGLSSVFDLLQQRGHITPGLDLNYLIGLEAEISTTTFAVGYARRVARDHARREVITASLKALELARSGVEDAREFLGQVEGMFADLTNHLGQAATALTPAMISERALEIVQERMTREPGVSCGIQSLDDLLGGGFRYGELVCIGGEPSFGKSALALAVVRGFARANGIPAGFVAGEQSAEELVVRQLAAQAKASSNTLNPGTLARVDVRAKFEHAARALTRSGVHIDAPRPFTLGGILRASRHMVERHGCRLIAWDYGQIIDAGTGDIRRDSVAVTRAAKQFAQKYDAIIVLPAQLLQGQQGRPTRERFKESKSYVEDADICLLLHRPDMRFCEADEETLGASNQRSVTPGTTLVICDKNRRGVWGPTVLTELRYLGAEFRYEQEDSEGTQEGLL